MDGKHPQPMVPAYGGGSLADLPGALLAALGVLTQEHVSNRQAALPTLRDDVTTPQAGVPSRQEDVPTLQEGAPTGQEGAHARQEGPQSLGSSRIRQEGAPGEEGGRRRGARDVAMPSAEDPLELAPADRICLFLVDGLGDELLRAHADRAPFLSSLTAKRLTAGFPATTVTSLCSLGTGLPPGEHGMLGLTLAVPGQRHLFNCLRWSLPRGLPPMDPAEWQPAETVYQRAARAGITAGYVGPAAFESTGLTEAVYRGVRYVPADTVEERVAGVKAMLAEPRAHVTVYHGDLDATGHLVGWGSPQWLDQLELVDDMAARLAETLPSGSALYVTADHGMVNAVEKIDAEATPELSEGVAMFGGEARARHVYTEEGAAPAVLEAWREVLAGKAWVASRQEAVDSGWFGPGVRREWLARIGDLVAVPYTDCVILASATHPIEAAFTGYHGSMTAAEQFVPLLEVSAR